MMSEYRYHKLAEEMPNRRIVLVGKTGVGKSAAGNTILGRKAFVSEPSFSSVTMKCDIKSDVYAGLNLHVIDTPGLFGTEKSHEEIEREIARCICMAAPGPHVFLIVLQLTRFTAEEKETLDIIKTMVGEESAKYTMVLFTQGDLLRNGNKTINQLLKKSTALYNFISQCSILEKFEDKYHVFDNTVEDSAQVGGLVEKINRMVKENGGSYYEKEIFKEAHRAKQEERELVIRNKPDIDHVDARRQAERDNSFIRDFRCPGLCCPPCVIL